MTADRFRRRSKGSLKIEKCQNGVLKESEIETLNVLGPIFLFLPPFTPCTHPQEEYYLGSFPFNN